MDLRLTFNEVPELYDKLRPTYVPELYSDIFSYSGIQKGSRALEIGIGTGQATRPFLDAGVHVTAIELGSNLAEFVKNKYKNYNNLEVINMSFEEYECEENTYDLIYSATAFHWIPENVGYCKVYNLLKSSGTFARFRNYAYKDKKNEAMHLASRKLYQRYFNTSIEPKEYSIQNAKSKSDISIQYGFAEQKFELYNRIRTMNSDNYSNLIKTYSDHIALGHDKLELFSEEIKNVINKYGGIINIYDTQDLHLARKP